MVAHVKLFIVVLLLNLGCGLAVLEDLSTDEILFVVLSQPNSHHAERANIFKQHLDEQREVDVIFTHKTWPDSHAWTLFTLVPLIKKHLEGEAHKWVCICEEETRFDLLQLIGVLTDHDPHEPVFLGHALFDKEPTVIHHYANHLNPGAFKYPDTAAGMFLSFKLIQDLGNRMLGDKLTTDGLVDFSIDPKHEFAKYVLDEGRGVALTHVERFCVTNDVTCASHVASTFPQCDEVVPDNQIYIAVKTCEKFHSDRVPVVKKTWAKETSSVEYMSETEDKSIPTVKLDVPNTETGHCAKMMGILEHALNHKQDKLWFIVVDDDTILSVRRLRRLLACYNPNEAVVLGERYGYKTTAGYGYDYVTGGGGTVLSRTALAMLIESGVCTCQSPDDPDDMRLGICLKRLGIPITHSGLFHQARPVDYSVGYLSHQVPVSFHKHWNIDPVSVYTEWLQEGATEHDEL